MIQAAMDAEIPQSILAGGGTVEEIAISNEKVHDTTLIQHVLQVLKATHLVDVEGDKVLPNRRTKSWQRSRWRQALDSSKLLP